MPLFFGWDDNFMGMMTGTGTSAPDPSMTIKKSHVCRKELHNLISHYLRDHLDETSPYIRDQWEKLAALGVPWDLRVDFAVMRSLWVGAANVTPTSIWAAAFTYQDATLVKKLRDELASGDSSLPIDERSPSSKLMAEETVRLTVLGTIARPVLNSTLLPTIGGGTLLARKGDLVLGQMRESHRKFNDRPDEFVFDRLEKSRMAGTKHIGYIPFGGGKGIVSPLTLLFSSCLLTTSSRSVRGGSWPTARYRLCVSYYWTHLTWVGFHRLRCYGTVNLPSCAFCRVTVSYT